MPKVRIASEAIQDLKLATDLCQANGFTHAFAWSAFELAKVYRDVGDYTDAEHYARATVEPMRKVEDKYHLPGHLSLLADLEVKRGDFAAADDFYSQAEDVTEGMLVNTPSRQVESSLIDTMSESYVGHFAIAARLKDARKAFSIVELARGRSIADAFARAATRDPANDPTILTARQKVNQLQTALIHATSSNERSKLLDELVTAEFYLAPTGKPVTRFQEAALRARPASLDAVRASLGGRRDCLGVRPRGIRILLPVHDADFGRRGDNSRGARPNREARAAACRPDRVQSSDYQ